MKAVQVKIRHSLVLAAFAAAALASGAASARDAAAGHDKVKQVCAACHSEMGDKPLQPEYPILAGQHYDYLVKALQDFKSGLRKNAIMGSQAQPLSEKDIENVAAWYSSLPSPLHVKR